MAKSDPFGFDIRVKSDKKKRARGKRGLSQVQSAATHVKEMQIIYMYICIYV